MLKNQYASRVLQKIVQYRDNEFTKKTIAKFDANHQIFLRDLSSVIFITKLVAYSIEPEKDFVGFIRFLKAHGETATEDTNLIRVMVPLFDIIELSTLAEIFQNFRPKIWQLINNKFGIYLVQKLIERGADILPV